MTHERFSKELIGFLQEKSIAELIKVPGIYEILSEEFNNDVLKRIKISEIVDKKLSGEDLKYYPAAWPKSLKKKKWQLDRLLEFYKEDTGEDFPWDDSAPEGFSIIDNLIPLVAHQASEELPYTETCPHCEMEVGASDLKGNCIICGKELIVCNMCLRPDLDGKEGSCKGCKHGSRMLLEKEEK